MKKTKVIVTMGLLIALDVVAALFLTIKTPYLKIGVSFIPVSFTGLLFGPLLGGAGAAVADVIQFFLYPSGAYIPGLTVDAFLSGAAYGLFFHNKKPSIWRCFAAVAVSRLIIGAVFNTFWLYLAIPGKTFEALFLMRGTENLIMVPIETAVIFAVWKITERTKLLSRFLER